MGKALENWRILAAAVFSVVLIGGAYMLAVGGARAPRASASTETALLQQIATKDTDGDGLPDWEESLYGTDPSKSDSKGLGMTDGEAVAKGLIVPVAISAAPSTSPVSSSGSGTVDPSLPPAPDDSTITAAFAKDFFTLYINAKTAKGGADLTEEETSTISQQALSDLAGAITLAPNFKSAKDLTVSGSGSDALKNFAVLAENVSKKNGSDGTKSEILYLQDAVTNNDATALEHIASIAQSYRTTAAGLAVLPVPSELADADLALINALMRASQVADDFTRVNTDPLAAMLAIQQYPDVILNLGNAFISIGRIYKNANITIAAGAPGASFVNLIADIEASQKADAKKP